MIVVGYNTRDYRHAMSNNLTDILNKGLAIVAIIKEWESNSGILQKLMPS